MCGLRLLPQVASLYVKQIEAGLDGGPRALKARMILRDLLGPIRLAKAQDGALWASYRFNSGVLLRATGTPGRGDRI